MARSRPIRPSLAAAALVAFGTLAGCIRPQPWTPEPPQGMGYAYRFQGVHRDVGSASVDTWRVGRWSMTDYYFSRRRGVSERENPYDVMARERFTPGVQADAPFNVHLGDLGERLEAAP